MYLQFNASFKFIEHQEERMWKFTLQLRKLIEKENRNRKKEYHPLASVL